MVDLEIAKTDPSSVYRAPAEVVNDPTLTKKQKIEILRSWAYDEREMAVAEEENMQSASDEPNYRLDEILKCLQKLGEDSDQTSPPPTKQG